MPWTVYAAGLGELKVLSSLGQPLLAEVDLIAVDKSELSSLTARLASPEAYTAANVPYSSALVGVRVSIEKRADGTPYIKITSVREVNDPFLDFLVELSWSDGKLVRQYTALIDPPGFTLPGVAAPPIAVAAPAAATPESKPIETPATAAPAETAPAAAAPPAEAAAQPEENKATETPAAEAKPGEAQQPAAPAEEAKAEESKAVAPGEYTVKHGDTLYRIANSLKPEGVTVEQMLVSLYRSNPGAFVGNMNRLKAGKILRVPEQDQISATGQSDAVKEIRVQTASWNAYRKALAEAAATTPAQEEEKAATSGKITTKVEEQPAAKKSPQEILKLSKGEAAAGKAGSPQERMQAMEEEATAREKALAEANDRVAQLEKQIHDMQHLLELKGVKVPAPAAPAMKAEAPPPASPSAASPEAPKAEPAAVAPTAAPAETSVSTASAPVATAPAAEKPAPAPKKKPKVVKAPPSLLDQILGEPLYLAGIGGALVVLGGIGYALTRRRQSGKADRAKKKPPRLSKTETEAAVDQPAAAAAPISAAPAAAIADDVDPIQEADLYLNFGRDAQAEEVLKEALEKNPKHEEAQLKLLQIYAGRKSKTEFEKIARALKETAGGTSANWLKAAALGYSFDPNNPLYEAGKSAPAAVAAAPAAAGVDLDFDIDVSTQSPMMRTQVDFDAGHAPLLQPDAASEIEDITQDSGTSRSAAMVTDITGGVAVEEAATHVMPDGAGIIDFGSDAPTVQPTTVLLDAGKQAADAGMDFDTGEAKDAAPLVPDFKIDFGDAATSPPPEIKLDDINLHLDGAAPEKPEGDGKDEHWFDVQTKFDLAKAYQEMGDKNGAREILQEVIKEGDAGQQEEARKLLAALD